MGKTSNRIKLFKKVFNEFLKEYAGITGAIITIPIKTIEPVNEYREDVESVAQQFADREINALTKIRLLSSINLTKVKINWEYLLTMYKITLDKDDKNLIEEKIATRDLNKQVTSQTPVNPLANLLGNGIGNLDISSLLNSNGIQSLIAEIAPVVTKSLEGKDPSQISIDSIMSDLVTGGSKSGVDTSSVLQQTIEKMKDKISSGEINLGQ